MNRTNRTGEGFSSYNQIVYFEARATEASPAVCLNADKKFLVISGNSSQENPVVFYKKIQYAVNKYFMLNKGRLFVFIKLKYFNTSSAQCIYNLILKMYHASTLGIRISINWYYQKEDEDMLEFGKGYQDVFNIKFNLIPY